MIKFSIMIPLYNKSAHITKTLNSIKNQNYQDYEVLIVNDGSTDDSRKVVEDFIEKPDVEKAPSTLACLGRYVLEPQIFTYLEKTPAGKGGEIQLTDAILAMINNGDKVLAYNFEGKRYDIGNKLGLLKANIEFGLRHPEIKDELKEYLENLNL